MGKSSWDNKLWAFNYPYIEIIYLRPVVLECLANLHARAGQLLMMIFNLQESTKC